MLTEGKTAVSSPIRGKYAILRDFPEKLRKTAQKIFPHNFFQAVTFADESIKSILFPYREMNMYPKAPSFPRLATRHDSPCPTLEDKRFNKRIY